MKVKNRKNWKQTDQFGNNWSDSNVETSLLDIHLEGFLILTDEPLQGHMNTYKYISIRRCYFPPYPVPISCIRKDIFVKRTNVGSIKKIWLIMRKYDEESNRPLVRQHHSHSTTIKIVDRMYFFVGKMWGPWSDIMLLQKVT